MTEAEKDEFLSDLEGDFNCIAAYVRELDVLFEDHNSDTIESLRTFAAQGSQRIQQYRDRLRIDEANRPWYTIQYRKNEANSQWEDLATSQDPVEVLRDAVIEIEEHDPEDRAWELEIY